MGCLCRNEAHLKAIFFPHRKLLIPLPHYYSAVWLNCKKELTVQEATFGSGWVWRRTMSWWAINIHGTSRIYTIWWSVFYSLLSTLFSFLSFLPFPMLLKPGLERVQLSSGKLALLCWRHQYRLQAGVYSSFACSEASSISVFITHSEGCQPTGALLTMLAASFSYLEK